MSEATAHQPGKHEAAARQPGKHEAAMLIKVDDAWRTAKQGISYVGGRWEIPRGASEKMSATIPVVLIHPLWHVMQAAVRYMNEYEKLAAHIAGKTLGDVMLADLEIGQQAALSEFRKFKVAAYKVSSKIVEEARMVDDQTYGIAGNDPSTLDDLF